MTSLVESRTLLMVNGTLDNLIPAAFRVESYQVPGRQAYVIYAAADVLDREYPLHYLPSLEDVAEKLVDEYAAFTTCDYCEQQAGWEVIDTTDEYLCTDCVMDHKPTGPVREYARKLTRNRRVALVLRDLVARDN